MMGIGRGSTQRIRLVTTTDMPPRKRVENAPRPDESLEPTVIAEVEETVPMIRKGQLVHLILNGRTLQFREILDWDDRFLKIRSDVTVAPQTEIVLIPWGQIESLGLTDER